MSKSLLLILFTLLSSIAFGQTRGAFTSIQGNLDRLAENADAIGIKDGDTIIFDAPYFHVEMFKLDSTSIDTFDTVEPMMLRAINKLLEKMPQVFITGSVQTTDGFRFFRSVLNTQVKQEMLPLLEQIADSNYRPAEDSLYFTLFNYAIHPTQSQRRELIKFTTPYLSELQLEVFTYLITTVDYRPLDFWLNKNMGGSSLFEVSTTKYTMKIPRVDNYVILLEKKGSNYWKDQIKKLKKEFGIKKNDAISGNAVTNEDDHIFFY